MKRRDRGDWWSKTLCHEAAELVEFVDAVREVLGLGPLPGVNCQRTRAPREEAEQMRRAQQED